MNTPQGIVECKTWPELWQTEGAWITREWRDIAAKGASEDWSEYDIHMVAGDAVTAAFTRQGNPGGLLIAEWLKQEILAANWKTMLGKWFDVEDYHFDDQDDTTGASENGDDMEE